MTPSKTTTRPVVETGVAWQSRIPANWAPVRVKYVLREKPSRSGIGLPCGAISFGEVVFKDGERIAEDTRATYQEVRDGEFLVNPINLNYDVKSLRTALSSINVCVSPAYIVLRSNDDACKRFLRYVLHQFDVAHMKTLGAGVRQTITFQDIGDCVWFLPPLYEQHRLASFLDCETARIDALIEKKTRFIELLREKRLALAHRALTKHRYPTTRLGRHIKVVNGFAFPSDRFTSNPEDWRLLRGINVGVGEVRWDEVVYWRRESGDQLEEYALREGDIVIGMDRTWIEAGTRVARLTANDTPALLLQRVCAIRPRPTLDAGYLMHLLDSDLLRKALWADQTGLSVPHISSNQIERFELSLPPLDEQRETSGALNNQLSELTSLQDTTKRSVELLRERRAALIAAGVTGQIDLRAESKTEDLAPA